MTLSNIVYAGYGAEIEDDVVRLQRRKLEAEDDAARRARQTRPRPRRPRALRRRSAAPATPSRVQ
ncbi:MAG TPA: hypothetical protein VGI74_22290 [Streptosporangiaceae bacterium]